MRAAKKGAGEVRGQDFDGQGQRSSLPRGGVLSHLSTVGGSGSANHRLLSGALSRLVFDQRLVPVFFSSTRAQCDGGHFSCALLQVLLAIQPQLVVLLAAPALAAAPAFAAATAAATATAQTWATGADAAGSAPATALATAPAVAAAAREAGSLLQLGAANCETLLLELLPISADLQKFVFRSVVSCAFVAVSSRSDPPSHLKNSNVASSFVTTPHGT